MILLFYCPTALGGVCVCGGPGGDRRDDPAERRPRKADRRRHAGSHGPQGRPRPALLRDAARNQGKPSPTPPKPTVRNLGALYSPSPTLGSGKSITPNISHRETQATGLVCDNDLAACSSHLPGDLHVFFCL